MWRFHQAEGFNDNLIDAKAQTLEELDALAMISYNILGKNSIGCYKCDIYKDGVRVDRFDLCPTKGVGVDDLGRTPSQMLKKHGKA